MIYTIHNDYLTVSVSSFGAELQSIRSGSNREYLWQGDLSIWSGRAPNLFPFVARLRDGVYRMDDKEYSMKIHGFAKYLEFECVKEEKDALVFELTSNEETLAQYPRDFRFQIGYSLNANGLSVTYTVVNLDKRTMFFGIGGHPGFNVPMEEGKKFEDYKIVFPEKCHPQRVIFSEKCYVDHLEDYQLEDETSLPLKHDLFDNDAVVLTNVPREITITSGSDKPYVKVSFPGMRYVGFWHMPHKEAPYVCVEPWVSLPGNEHEPTVFENKEDLISLEPGAAYENKWEITIWE